jgi:hypothetical protein
MKVPEPRFAKGCLYILPYAVLFWLTIAILIITLVAICQN